MSLDRVAASLAAVAEYRGSDLYRAFWSLLDDLAVCYRDDLETVAPERLQRTQGALAQVKALQQALVGAEKDPAANYVLPKV